MLCIIRELITLQVAFYARIMGNIMKVLNIGSNWNHLGEFLNITDPGSQPQKSCFNLSGWDPGTIVFKKLPTRIYVQPELPVTGLK